jgi:TRAP-type C4-dicarboxylate transport system permease small subunit
MTERESPLLDVSYRASQSEADDGLKPYVPERQHDWVRLVVTLGLLATFIAVIALACWACVRPTAQWTQTKEMLQILLPAITGLLGSVIGFYFGSGSVGDRKLD